MAFDDLGKGLAAAMPTPSDSAMTAERTMVARIRRHCDARELLAWSVLHEAANMIERLTADLARVEWERDEAYRDLHITGEDRCLWITRAKAAESEAAALKHDIERHYNMTCEQANEIVSLRDALGTIQNAHIPDQPAALGEAMTTPTLEELCRIGHDAYEAAATATGQETRADSKTEWANVPEPRKELMRAAYRAVVRALEPVIAESAHWGIVQRDKSTGRGHPTENPTLYAARLVAQITGEKT